MRKISEVMMPAGRCRSLLISARNRNMRIETLGMRNSGDVTGDKSRVVGYGAWALYQSDEQSDMEPDIGEDNFAAATEDLIKTHGSAMLELCRKSILHGLETGAPLHVSAGDVPPALAAPGACFVTLKKSGHLRGCIGSIIAHCDLATDLCENAFKAAFRDPRFGGLSRDEINDDLELSISVLSPPHPFPFANEADLIARPV